MKKTLKKSVSILLTFIMVFSVFSVVPFTVSAAGSVLTLSDSNASGTGWTWNASTKTLTMSGATFDDCVWLKVDSATIVLTDGTNNVMHGGMYNTTSTGRKCWSCICVGTIMPTASGQFFETEGTLTIKGSGKLTMSPTTTTHYFDTFAINCYKLIFGTGSDNPVLDYTAQKSYFHSYALQMNSGFTLNSGNIKLSCGDFARSGQDWYAVGVLVRNGGANAIVINDGSLEIDVSEGALTFNSNNDVISTCKGLNTLNSGSITINGGNIDINVAGNANTQRCIDASGKVTINAGTLKLKNTKNNQAAYAGGNLAIGGFTTYTDCSQSGKYIYLTSTDTQGTIVTKKPCTVTWKNGDDVLKTEAVAEGSTPSYDGTTPEKAEDENYTYTFSGWNNGETTYAPDQLPAVSGNVTYTAQYTATAKTFKVYAKKLTGETYTIENLTGETTVAQLKEIIADQIDIPATAQRLIFAGKQLEDAKTLAENNIGKESTIHLVIRGYTVTWLNYDNSELGTTNVQYGSTPTYNGEPPTKPEDANNTYTFAGWKVGETTYAPSELPAVTGDVTYTAQFTAKPKTLIAGHSLSLDGNIGINFYLDPSVAGLTVNEVTKDNLNYTFAWADVETTKAKVNVAEQANQKNFRVSEDGKYIIITCYVCAAEMTCGVNATFTLNGKTESESEPYTVRKYCDDSVLSENAQYKDDTELVELVKAMLNYGAKAQTVFGIKTDDLANDGLDYVMQDVTTEMFDTAILTANDRAADDIAANAPAGAGFKTSSLVFLSESTLRLYFAKENDSFNTSGMTKWNDYYYTQVVDIPAAQLDTLQQFNVSGTTLCYSALDYAKALAAAGNADNAALAKALYWYNQAANAYFE